MNRQIFYLGVALAVLLAFSQYPDAADIRNMADQGTLRCAGGIVAIGASDREVLDKCGDPLDAQRLQDVGPVWIYSMGQSKFMYYLAFMHGKLQRIASAPCRSNDYDCYDLR